MASRTLKKGFTTGAAAAAAAKAALISLFSSPVQTVEICFLTGEKKQIPVFSVSRISETSCEALVIKDAGDDPDITHNARIGARVTVSDAPCFRIQIKGGRGVGRITKPGLELPVGEPAINPGPRQMIQNEITAVARELQMGSRQVEVVVFVPDGETLAKKTLNKRLGILGGISILGTTGIVTPMSHDAYIATIKSSIAVAAAAGTGTLVFTTGRRSERFAMASLPDVNETAFIQTGDFFKAALEAAAATPGIQSVVYAIFFGKAVKMALGYAHTHAAKSELTLKTLSQWAKQLTGSRLLEQQVAAANTARHAFSYLYPEYPAVLEMVARNAKINAMAFSGQALEISVMIFDFNGGIAVSINETA